jgi:hypothetical protein
VLDAWLSIQSVVGIMHAINPLAYGLAATFGIALTIFAICLPILREGRKSRGYLFLWLILTAFDLGTSSVGAIWYGMMHNPMTEPVHLSELQFDFDNWLETGFYIGGVLLVAWACVMFGKALNARRKK